MDNNSINKNGEDYKEGSSVTQGDTVNIPPISENLPPQDNCINIPSCSDAQNKKACLKKDNALPNDAIYSDSDYNYENSANDMNDKNCAEGLYDKDNVSDVHNPYDNDENVEFNKREFSETPHNYSQHKAEDTQNSFKQDFNNPYVSGFNQAVPPQGVNNPYANGFNQAVPPQGVNNPYANGFNQAVPSQGVNNPYANGFNQAVPPQGVNNPYANGFNQAVPPQGVNNPYANGFNQAVPPQGVNNPYADAGNVSQPTVEYVPYVPGTPLPNGVTPQFINGRWYYPIMRLSQSEKKKMATSVKVLLSVIVALILAFIVLLVVWCTNLETGSNSAFDFGDNGGFTFELPTEDDESSTSSGEVGKYADPDGPEINLEKNNTVSGSTEKAYEALSDSVVSIAVYEKNCNPANDTATSEGTGIILSADGYMVTNSHVINDSTESNVYVTTKDGKVFSAVVVGCDVRTDIAVLKSDDATGWKPASFADSKQIKVGQDVVAIGSPGGASYSNSLTRGIVSALERTLSGSAVTYIQTDAAINPGNSGGPLANMNGQVIGINTIKVVDTEYEGMGFAIPSVTVKEIADQLIKNGYVKGRARMGIVGREISEDTAKILGGEAGICINSIDDDSPLKNTKVKEGDVITKIDDTSITSFNELFSTLDSYNIGDTVTLSIYRGAENATKNEEYFTVKITLLGENE
ncbi:MAG: trypsin-like peptidase domain-containing protein [Acutalibacteraceae bacterium]|nr:trypsin-like peptidase domain-containing protein [Acutalibacteraceae bacterium]